MSEAGEFEDKTSDQPVPPPKEETTEVDAAPADDAAAEDAAGADAMDADAEGAGATEGAEDELTLDETAPMAAVAEEGGDGSEKSGSKNNWKWVALGLLFVLLAGIIVLIVLTRSDTIEVPDVRNLTLEDATASIESAGLEVGEVAYLLQTDSDAAPGTVSEQSPKAGSQVDAGSKVDLLVVTPTQVEVPNVVGFEVSEATEVLERLGLEVTTEDVDYVGASAGDVVGQSPTAGTQVDPGSTVKLTVATGRSEGPVPDVVGTTQQAATSKLETAGFAVSVEEAYDADVDKGIVISQRPQAGVTAAVGEVVTIVVSLGTNPQVAVPNVVGQTESAAANILNQYGLEPVPSSAYSATVPAGSVISQNPVAGTVVLQGSFVTMVVSLGAQPPATATVPDVLGKSEAEATSTLQGAGYQVVSVEVYSDTVTIGTVGWQIPVGGSITEPGITVGIIVSAGPRPPDFTIVPDVRSMSLADATQELEDAGLQVESYEVYTSLAPAGQVVAQVPAPGGSVAPGSTVIVIVSKGEAVVTPH